MTARTSRLSRFAVAASLVWGTPALAQNSDTVVAEALFQEGRALLEAGNTAEACPKLAESLRLDPATGTLMALAICHEKEGKLATAWSEYVEAESRARRDGRTDREEHARERVAALKERLSLLTIRVSPAVAAIADLEVRRDGVALGRGAWNAAVPIDGGEHVVQASAPGKNSWQGRVTVKAEGDRAEIVVPELSALPSAAPPPAAPPAPLPLPVEPAPSRGWGTLEWVGVGAAGVGLVGLGVGGYFLADALGKMDDSEDDCSGDFCGEQGRGQRSDAVERGNLATLLAIGGGVLVAGGATLFLVGRSSDGERSPSAALRVNVAPNAVAAGLTGSF